MKRYTILFALSFVLSIGTLFAQFPELMNYQGVARDAGGNALAGQAIGLRISIVSGSPTGNVEYQETHAITTNNYGLFNIQIGSGTPTSGQFALIDWGAASHYASIEMDPAGGTTYQVLGTNQLVASPYAMHAKTVDNADDADADPTNEIQILSKSGSTVTLSGGGGTFTDDVDDADADATNEIQLITKSGSTVTLSGGGGSFTDDVDDADADATNEIQTLSTSGSTVTLSGGGGSFSIIDADASVTNELQTISKSGSTVTLSNAGGSFTDDVNDADASATNEIQTLALSGQTLSISSGNSVTLTAPPASVWTDLGTDVRPTGFENVVSGGDFITSSGNGVINCGGGLINANANVISDFTTAVITVSTGDEDLYIDGTLEVSDNCYKTGGGSWLAISDRRTKRDIIPYTDGLASLMKISPVKFKYKEKFAVTERPDEEYVGVIAQDMLEIAPYMVKEAPFFREEVEQEDGSLLITNPGEMHYTYDATALNYMLVNSVQEQQQIIVKQQEEIDELKAKVAKLEALDARLKALENK